MQGGAVGTCLLTASAAFAQSKINTQPADQYVRIGPALIESLTAGASARFYRVRIHDPRTTKAIDA